jgi:hypothetical protein
MGFLVMIVFYRKTLVVHIDSMEPHEAHSKYYIPIPLKKVFPS